MIGANPLYSEPDGNYRDEMGVTEEREERTSTNTLLLSPPQQYAGQRGQDSSASPFAQLYPLSTARAALAEMEYQQQSHRPRSVATAHTGMSRRSSIASRQSQLIKKNTGQYPPPRASAWCGAPDDHLTPTSYRTVRVAPVRHPDRALLGVETTRQEPHHLL